MSTQRRKNGKTIRYHQSALELEVSRCKGCGDIVRDGIDYCWLCDCPAIITIQYAEAMRYQAEEINAEYEKRYATD